MALTAQNQTVLAPQGGRLLNMSIPANTTQRAVSTGTQAYLIVATAPVNMRPLGGDFVTYSQGTGVNTNLPFAYVEIENFQSYPVVISIWIGFDSFIDNRLILANEQNANIAFPTYPVPNAATFINIVDLTGGPFRDINGNLWLALNRVAIQIFNLDAGNSYPLYQYNPAGSAGTNRIAEIPPAPLPLRLDISGNFTINVGGASVNMVISEIYNAIPAIT